jgi:hypothetical protein
MGIGMMVGSSPGIALVKRRFLDDVGAAGDGRDAELFGITHGRTDRCDRSA